MKAAEKFINNLQEIKNDLDKIKQIHAKINNQENVEILTVEQLQQIYTHVLTAKFLVNELGKLKLNKSLRFVKKSTTCNPLPRTCVIQKISDEQFELLVITNKTIADNTKVAGRVKVVNNVKSSVAYCINDLQETNVKRFISKLQFDDKDADKFENKKNADRHKKRLDQIGRKSKITPKLKDSPFVLPLYSGKYVNKHNRKTVYTSSKLALGDLCDLNRILNAQEMLMLENDKNVPDFFISIITDLINGLCDIHEKRIIHGDLSRKNIVLFRGKKLSAKYIDFGLASDLNDGDAEIHGCTFAFASAEIYGYFLSKGRAQHSNPFYGVDVFYENVQKYDELFSTGQVNLDYKDDVWSLGVIIFLILTNIAPRSNIFTDLVLSNNPLLQGMLAKTRQDRFTAMEALTCWQKNPVLVKIDSKSVDLQIEINEKFFALKDALQNNCLVRAIELLQECILLNNKITNPQDVHAIGYISTAHMQESLRTLNFKLTEHNELLPEVVHNVLKYLQNNVKDFAYISCAQYILQKIESSFAANWSQLYAADIERLKIDLTEKLSKEIISARQCGCYFYKYYVLTDEQISTLINHCVLHSKPDLTQKIELPLMNLEQLSPRLNLRKCSY
jgi:serine/threonine protein kinase